MKRSLSAVVAALALPLTLVVYGACSNDDSSNGSSGSSGASSSSSGSSGASSSSSGSSGSSSSSSGSSGSSGGSDADPGDAANDGCTTPTKADLDGGGLCGARAFGSPAAILMGTDAAFGVDGSVPIPPGVYDVTSGVRAASLPYSWRETLVLDGTRFTQIRRFDTTQGNEGPTNSRAGTYTTTGGNLTLVSDCGKNMDGGDLTPSTVSVQYEVVNDGCNVKLHVIVAGTTLTYTRR